MDVNKNSAASSRDATFGHTPATIPSAPPPPERRVYTVEEAAEVLRVRRTLMYHLIASRQVRSLKVGARRLVPAEALDEFIREGLARGE